jgi:sirohydrochlorin cobaltochelatase
MTKSSTQDGLLLFAHGARDPAWARPFQAIAEQLQAQRPDLILALAYLELMSPDLQSAAETLVAQGCTHIQIVPMFLGASGHVRRDVPPLVEALRQRHPGVQWQLHDAIGEQPTVIRAMAAATLDLLAPSPPTP